MKTKQESIRVARKALHLYEIGMKEDARKLAKRVSWRTLFLEAVASGSLFLHEEWIDVAIQDFVLITDKLKGIES